MRRAARDDGQITVLTIGFVVLAVALVLVLVAATEVHLGRTRLVDTTDLAVLDAADAVSEADYYGASDRPTVPLTERSVRAAVTAYLAAHPDPHLSDVAVVDVAVPDARTARVTVRAVVHPAMLTPLLADWAPGVRVEVTSTARAG